MAQKHVAKQEHIKQFFQTTTLVVVNDNPMSEYNLKIRESVKKSWKITDFEFISEAEYGEKRKNPDYSFLTIDKVYYEKDKNGAQYEFMCLSLGGNYKKEDDMPQLCCIPLCYFGVEEDYYTYKLGTLVNFMQNHMLITSKDPGLNEINIISYYNKNRSDIKEKTLYIVKDELSKDVNSAAEIKKVYPYKFKLVTRGEVEEAVDNEDDNVVFLHKVGPDGTRFRGRSYKVLLGAKDARLYYFNYHMLSAKKPDGLLKSDFKKLAK